MQDVQHMTLENIGNGAASEKFQDALDRVMENILDPNTDPKKARSITLKITFKPDVARDKFQAVIDCTEKLAASEPFATPGWIGKERGKAVALHIETPKQEELEIPAPSLVKKGA